MRLTTRILLGYSLVCVILIGVSIFLAYRSELGPSLSTAIWFSQAIVFLAVFGAFIVRGFGRFVEAVSTSDRRIALIFYAWVYGPLLVAFVFFTVGWAVQDAPISIPLPNLRSTGVVTALRYIAALAAVTWVLVSAPIARLWATNNAENPEALLHAEEFLFVTETQREIEAQVSIPTYYMLVLSILTILFLILEGIVGELFEWLTGISGFVGAAVAALGVAALLYPINRRVNTFVRQIREVAQESGRADTLNALKDAIVSTRQYMSAEFESAPFILVIFILFLLGWGFGAIANLS